MVEKFNVDKDKSNLNFGAKSLLKSEKKTSTKSAEMDEIEDIETTTVFTHFKKTDVILRTDTALYVLGIEDIEIKNLLEIIKMVNKKIFNNIIKQFGLFSPNAKRMKDRNKIAGCIC